MGGRGRGTARAGSLWGKGRVRSGRRRGRFDEDGLDRAEPPGGGWIGFMESAIWAGLVLAEGGGNSKMGSYNHDLGWWVILNHSEKQEDDEEKHGVEKFDCG